MNKVKMSCNSCDKCFYRNKKEVTRSLKLNRRFYCSLKCSGKQNYNHLSKYQGNSYPSANKGKILTTQESPFVKLLHRIRTRIVEVNKEHNIDLNYILYLWNKQKKVCPYTGWELVLHNPSKNAAKRKSILINQISVDRIDSKLGYVKGNIQLISLIANYAKHVFKEEEMLNFCKAVALYQYKNIKFNYKNTIKSFKIFIKLAKQRSKNKNGKCYYKGLTVEYLQELWIKQKGTCPYTGWKLDLPQKVSDWNNTSHHIKRASLDRIDNSKGYVPGNVQFVSVIYNYAKGQFTDKDVQVFCKAVYNYRLRP